MITLLLYQPLPFAGVVGAPETLGGVTSIMTVPVAASPVRRVSSAALQLMLLTPPKNPSTPLAVVLVPTPVRPDRPEISPLIVQPMSLILLPPVCLVAFTVTVGPPS